MPHPSREDRALVTALFFVAAYAVLSPFLYEAQRLLPPAPSSADWRLGAGGFLLEAVTTPTLGLAGAMALAWYDARWGVMRGVAWVALVGALLTLLVWALFLREVLSMRPGIPEAARGVFDAAAIRGLLIGGLSAPMLALVGVAGLRLGRARIAQDGEEAGRGLVVPAGDG